MTTLSNQGVLFDTSVCYTNSLTVDATLRSINIRFQGMQPFYSDFIYSSSLTATISAVNIQFPGIPPIERSLIGIITPVFTQYWG